MTSPPPQRTQGKEQGDGGEGNRNKKTQNTNITEQQMWGEKNSNSTHTLVNVRMYRNHSRGFWSSLNDGRLNINAWLRNVSKIFHV